jgi:hypothetical protein
VSDRPAAITVRSHTRTVALNTPLDDDQSWLMLLIPEGSSDAQVLEWAEETLPAEAVAELAEIIQRQADGGGAA